MKLPLAEIQSLINRKIAHEPREESSSLDRRLAKGNPVSSRRPIRKRRSAMLEGTAALAPTRQSHPNRNGTLAPDRFSEPWGSATSRRNGELDRRCGIGRLGAA